MNTFISTPGALVAIASIVIAVCATIRYCSKQRRLKHRDDRDYDLRRHMFDQERDATVLDDIPALREAERPLVALPGLKPQPPPEAGPE